MSTLYRREIGRGAIKWMRACGNMPDRAGPSRIAAAASQVFIERPMASARPDIDGLGGHEAATR